MKRHMHTSHSLYRWSKPGYAVVAAFHSFRAISVSIHFGTTLSHWSFRTRNTACNKKHTW